jgi:flagellar biosynthesis GTPase FlhF
MQVQRFRKPTVREALAEVRQTLGPEALVISTLMVPMRGWRRITGRREVEVTAAGTAMLSETRLDDVGEGRARPASHDDAASRARDGETSALARGSGVPAVPRRTRASAVARAGGAPAHGGKASATHTWAGTSAPHTWGGASAPHTWGGASAPHVWDQTEARLVMPTPAPANSLGADVVARLVAAGLDRGLAAEVAAALPPKARRDPSERVLVETLAGRLAPLVAGPEPLAPIEVFVGPPGAGKTTTIAKLAAQVRARHGARPTLVAADGYRVGAVEQLRLYADILGLPFVVARTALDLERAMATAGRPMLVDTAGRSPADRGIRDLFDVLSGRPGVRTHLVLPAALSGPDAARVLDRYDAAAPGRVVLSKVDETESACAFVALLRSRELQVSWIGCGQSVPEDLVRATGCLLAAGLLGEPITAMGTQRTVPEAPCA